jgi:hypothetical protein
MGCFKDISSPSPFWPLPATVDPRMEITRTQSPFFDDIGGPFDSVAPSPAGLLRAS